MVLTLRAKGPLSQAALVPACRIPASLLQRYCDILIKQGLVRVEDSAGPVYGLTSEAISKLDRVFENISLQIASDD
jgi:hypothetical protein